MARKKVIENIALAADASTSVGIATTRLGKPASSGVTLPVITSPPASTSNRNRAFVLRRKYGRTLQREHHPPDAL